MPSQYQSAFLAFFVCACFLPAVIWLARKLNLYDSPGPLKIHEGRIPRLGGIAMAAGLLASAGLFFPLNSWQAFMALFALLGVWAVGLADDVLNLPSIFRFFVQIAAGGALWFAGWRVDWFRIHLLDFAATCLFVALVINAMNLLDGMDGLAAGMGIVISLGFVVISTGSSDIMGIITAWSLLGVCFGVLTANAPPAKIFMGDSGSTLIGVVLAFLSLDWVRIEPASHSMVVPIIFLGIPIADVGLAILRRIRSRAALFTGDRNHYYDILLRRGWTVRHVLEVSFGISCLLVLTGWLCARGMLSAGIAAGISATGLASAAYFLGSLQLAFKLAQNSHEGTPLGSALD